MGILIKIKELGGQTVIYGLGDALHKAIGFVLIPIYLKFLDPAQFGIVETLLVTMGLMVTLANIGLPEAIFRYYFKLRNNDERKKVVSTIFFLSLIGQFTISGIFLWHSELISTLLFKTPEFAFLLSLSAINIFLSAFRSMPLAIFRAQKRAFMFVTVNCTTTTVMLLANVYFVAVLEKGVLGIMFGFLCGSFVGVAIALPSLIREIKLTFEMKMVKEILQFALPLGLSHLPLTIIFMADRYILAHLASLSQLGIYTLASKLGKFIKEFVILPFRLSWGPFIFANENTQNANFIYSKMTTYFSIVATAIIVLVSVFSFDLISLLTSKQEYQRAGEIVPIICYAFLFFGLCFFLGTGIRLSKKTYYLTIVMTISASINIPLNYVLIDLYGYKGAAYTIFITFFIAMILTYWASSKVYNIDYEVRRISLILLSSTFIIGCALYVRLTSNLLDFSFRIGLVVIYFIIMYFIGLSSSERAQLTRLIGAKLVP